MAVNHQAECTYPEYPQYGCWCDVVTQAKRPWRMKETVEERRADLIRKGEFVSPLRKET